ncbi:MAG: hypothetical protein KAT48_12060 [Bacteroidales bacterium]|nr:hypothetical protein [Bacteroidales bacterium]
MKTVISITILMIFALNTVANNDQSSRNKVSQESTIKDVEIEVYYFHNTRRCATCQAVEDVTRSALKDLYPEMVNNKQIIFVSLNIEDETNEPLAEKYQVSGQSLLFVSENETVDLTNKAFMYARTNPDKLKKEIKVTIDDLLK